MTTMQEWDDQGLTEEEIQANIFIGREMQDAVFAKRPMNPDAPILIMSLHRHLQPGTPATDVTAKATLAESAGLSLEEIDAALDWLSEIDFLRWSDGRLYVNPMALYAGAPAHHVAAKQEWARLVAEQA